jgi:large subunit ribosomal protein L9
MPSAILLQDVEALGARGAVVDVSKGYLRNYLLPRKLAQPATKGALAEAERQTVLTEKAAVESAAAATTLAEQLNKTVLTISQKAGDDGRLFGSVTAQDIADAIREARGATIDKRQVALGDPIKTTGTHMVEVEVAKGLTATVKTIVTDA